MRILCFGDSLTWGYTPYGGRYPHPWPDVLQSCRRQDMIITEGMPGRTACGSLPVLKKLLQDNQPDITLIMLGSNDLSHDCGRTIQEVLKDLKELGVLAAAYGKVILMAPPVICEEVDPGWHYDAGISHKMILLSKEISVLAEQNFWGFVNTQKIVMPVIPDGLHIDTTAHRTLGIAVNSFLEEFIKKRN